MQTHNTNKFGMGITVFPEKELPPPSEPSLSDVPPKLRRMIEKYDKCRCNWRLNKLSQPTPSKISKKYESQSIRPGPRREMKIEYEMLDFLDKAEPLW